MTSAWFILEVEGKLSLILLKASALLSYLKLLALPAAKIFIAASSPPNLSDYTFSF